MTTHSADLHELLGADIVGVDNERLGVLFQQAGELLLILQREGKIHAIFKL